MEITGKIKQIDATKEYGSNGFQKRELVLTTEEQYPQHILIEFVQDKCGLLDSFSVGQRIKVGINIRGREWQSPQGEIKYFNSIQGWRIDAAESSTPPLQQLHPLKPCPMHHQIKKRQTTCPSN
jgi:hypothetical protein